MPGNFAELLPERVEVLVLCRTWKRSIWTLRIRSRDITKDPVFRAGSTVYYGRQYSYLVDEIRVSCVHKKISKILIINRI